MTEALQVLLGHHLKTLKLPTFLREYEKQARPRRCLPPKAKVCAHPRAGLDHVQFLARLVEMDMRIIEIFRRGQKPMSRAPPREQDA